MKLETLPELHFSKDCLATWDSFEMPWFERRFGFPRHKPLDSSMPAKHRMRFSSIGLDVAR
jgi:hypothetical protein